MDLAAARLLVSDRGRDLLEAARATRGEGPLARRKALDGRFAPEEIRTALAEDDLRVRAFAKTPLSERLLFTREALEQATPAPVAAERARRFAAFDRVADLGAGIGLDALELARTVRHVVAVERDPVRATLLRHNAAAAEGPGRLEVVEGDFLDDPPAADAAFLDPDRRPEGRRERDPRRFEPPIEAWEALARRYAHLLVKLPPATRPEDHPGAGLEWVSLDGEMREARRGHGALALPRPRRATMLPDRGTIEGDGRPWPAPRAPRRGDVLIDPDPAIVLAGLLGEAAASVGAAPVHPRIAYLLADHPVAWGSCLLVEEVLPAAPPAIEAALAARGVGTLDVRTRGVEDPPEAWRRRLRFSGRGRATLVLSRGPDDRYFAVLGSVAGLGGRIGSGPAGIP